MRRTCCQTFIASILKFLNFLQAFIGVSMIIYSVYMLEQWHRHQDDGINPLSSVVSLNALASNANSLPAPWFIYAFMGIGILVFCLAFVGYVSAEASVSFCLCFYALLAGLFLLLEVGLVVFIAIDHHWEKDLPYDPTKELYKLRSFIEENVDVFEWVGIAILAIQALSLLFAIILRSLVMVSHRREEDLEGDYGSTSTSRREPLLGQYSGQASATTPRGDSDIWSSRMREKYGLNSSDVRQNLLSETRSTDA